MEEKNERKTEKWLETKERMGEDGKKVEDWDRK